MTTKGVPGGVVLEALFTRDIRRVTPSRRKENLDSELEDNGALCAKAVTSFSDVSLWRILARRRNDSYFYGSTDDGRA